MKNETVTLSRELAENSANYMEGSASHTVAMWSKQIRAAMAEPVPPADGEVGRDLLVTELAEFMSRLSGGLRHFAGAIIDAGWQRSNSATSENIETLAHLYNDGNPVSLTPKGEALRILTSVESVELVDRAHVTRLQAEVESERTLRRNVGVALHARSDEVKDLQAELTKARESNKADRLAVSALQVELNKARELFARIMKTGVLSFEGEPSQEQTQLECDVCSYLANRSAPAAKDGE